MAEIHKAFACSECGRLWVRSGKLLEVWEESLNKYGSGVWDSARSNYGEVGSSHYSWVARGMNSGIACTGLITEVDRPELIAAYMVGGSTAVEDFIPEDKFIKHNATKVG